MTSLPTLTNGGLLLLIMLAGLLAVLLRLWGDQR